MDRTHHVNLNSLVSSTINSEWISLYSLGKSPMSCFFMSTICCWVDVISSLFAVLSKAVPGFSWCFVVVAFMPNRWKPDDNVILPFSVKFLFCSNEFALQIRIFDLRFMPGSMYLVGHSENNTVKAISNGSSATVNYELSASDKSISCSHLRLHSNS